MTSVVSFSLSLWDLWVKCTQIPTHRGNTNTALQTCRDTALPFFASKIFLQSQNFVPGRNQKNIPMKEAQSTLNSWSGGCQSEEMENVTVTKPWKDMISHQLLCWNTHSIKRVRNIFQLYVTSENQVMCSGLQKPSEQLPKKEKRGAGGAVSTCQKEYFECIWIFARHRLKQEKALYNEIFAAWCLTPHPSHLWSVLFMLWNKHWLLLGTSSCTPSAAGSLLSAGTSVSSHRAEHVHVCALSRAKERIPNLSSSMKESKKRDQKGLRGMRPCWCVSGFKQGYASVPWTFHSYCCAINEICDNIKATLVRLQFVVTSAHILGVSGRLFPLQTEKLFM